MLRTTRARSAAAATAAAAGSHGPGSKQEDSDGGGRTAHSRPNPAAPNADADADADDARRPRDWRPRMLACLLSAQLLLALTPGLYRSTDFEVHRNWLAVTSSLPLAEWYRDATSPAATLDYPPLFAWFERALAAAARLVLPAPVARDALRLQAEPHASEGCVLFQRLTVVVTGLALAGAAWWAGGVGGKSGGGGISAHGMSADGMSADGMSAAGMSAAGMSAAGMSAAGMSAAGMSAAGMSAVAAAAALRKNLLFFLIACDAGLLLVDHVHFQYNGWLLALLLVSVLLVERGGGVGGAGVGHNDEDSGDEDISAAAAAVAASPRWSRAAYFFLASVAFSALLNAKHLFAHAAPAFFVYLLRGYVLQPAPVAPGEGKAITTTTTRGTTKTTTTTRRTTTAAAALARLGLLAAAVVAVFGASLGPFYAAGALPDLAARLFPFGRGLLHAYWAPNAWALYAALDKALALLFAPSSSRSAAGAAGTAAAAAAAVASLGGTNDQSSPLLPLPLLPKTPKAASMSGGLVGVAEFALLPQAGPRAAAAATLLSMLPSLAALWRRPDPRRFAAAVAHGCLCGFMFGYHVHEKAALTFLVPMALLAARPGGGHNGGGGGGGGCGGGGGSGAAEDEAAAAGRGATTEGGKRRQEQQQRQQMQRRGRQWRAEGRARADADAAVDFLLSSTAGHAGILPLLFRPQEAALRWAPAAFYFAAAAWGLGRQQQQQQQQELAAAMRRRRRRGAGETTAPVSADGGKQQTGTPPPRRPPPLPRSWLSYGGGGAGWRLAWLYAGGCAALGAFNAAAAPALLPRLPFLPLLLTSVWCAWPIALVWARTTALWAVEALSPD